MNHKMRCFAAIANSCTQSPQFLPQLPRNPLQDERKEGSRTRSNCTQIIWGWRKNCLEKGERLLLIRLRAPFVAKSAGGVWEKQFHKSLELGNPCPAGGGRLVPNSLQLHVGQQCTMHICIYLQICKYANMISAYLQICKYASISVQLHEWRKSVYLCIV